MLLQCNLRDISVRDPMRVLLPCLLAAVSAIRTGPNDNDCTANSGEFGVILDEDGFATCIHKYVVEPHSECPPSFKGMIIYP